MKLRNKKTGEVINLDYIIVSKDYLTLYTVKPETEEYCYRNLESLCEDWEDVKPIEFSRYYLINEETGYIATFDSEREMKIFQNEIDGWKPVKVLLDD